MDSHPMDSHPYVAAIARRLRQLEADPFSALYVVVATGPATKRCPAPTGVAFLGTEIHIRTTGASHWFFELAADPRG